MAVTMTSAAVVVVSCYIGAMDSLADKMVMEKTVLAVGGWLDEHERGCKGGWLGGCAPGSMDG